MGLGRIVSLLGSCGLVVVGCLMSAAAPIDGTFSYQGRLTNSGSAITGTADLKFRLYDDSAAGAQVGSEIELLAVPVQDGLFEIELDFGVDSFNGDERWLEIRARYPAGVGGYTLLSPRQEILGAPYAIQTRGIFVDDDLNVGIGTIPDKARLEVRSTNSRPTAWLARRNPQDFSVVEILTLRTLTLGTEKNGLGGRISFRGHVPGFADAAAPNFGDIDVIRQDGGDAGEMIFRVRTEPWVDNTDEITERMRLTPDFVQVKGPLHAQSSLNINSASNYANRIAPLVVGDATGSGAAILMDGNQIEAASGIDLIINFNSAADLRLNEGGGDVGIGRTPSFQLHLSRNSAAKPTSNVWTISSDERLKQNIKAIDGALDDLLRLRGVTYQWRDPESQGRMNGTYTGMLAQDVERVFPEWIGRDANGYKTLTVIGFEGIVVEALRELRDEKDLQLAETYAQISDLRAEKDAEIDALRAENEMLRARLESIDNRLDAMASPRKENH